MKCPRCGRGTKVVSTLHPADGGSYRHLNKDGYIQALEKYGGNWINRQRVCAAKNCGWTGTSIELLEEPT